MLRRILGDVVAVKQQNATASIILLSVKAGLRACEIARLDWSMVLDARGTRAPIAWPLPTRSPTGAVEHPNASQPRGRALVAFRSEAHKGKKRGSFRSWRRHAAEQCVNWLAGLLAGLELEGCSSHSGRHSLGGGRRETRTGPAAACAGENCWPVTSRYR